MRERQPGEYTPFDTRAESNETVDRQVRYRQIIEILREGPATAKETAVKMHEKGYTRLTELSERGVVEPVRQYKVQIHRQDGHGVCDKGGVTIWLNISKRKSLLKAS